MYLVSYIYDGLRYTILIASGVDLAYPAFKDRFGIVAPNGDRVIPASWQNGISGATNVGEIIGLQVRTIKIPQSAFYLSLVLNFTHSRNKRTPPFPPLKKGSMKKRKEKRKQNIL